MMTRADATAYLASRYPDLSEETGTTLDDSSTGYQLAIDDALVFAMGVPYTDRASATIEDKDVPLYQAALAYHTLLLFSDRVTNRPSFNVGTGVTENKGVLLSQIREQMALALKRCKGLGYNPEVEGESGVGFSTISTGWQEPTLSLDTEL